MNQSQILASVVFAPARVDTPQVPFQLTSQQSSSHISQMSGPLFTEDRYSTSSDEDRNFVMLKWTTSQDKGHCQMQPQ